jgi:hypothetical protein
MPAMNTDQRTRRRDGGGLAGRIWRGLPAVLFALMEGDPTPAPPGPLTVAEMLDRVGAFVARGVGRLEQTLGLRPKNWPPR